MYFDGRGRLVTTVALFLLTLQIALAQTPEQIRKSQQGRQMMADGRFAEAVPIYSELSSALPSNTGLRLNLALALHMSGRHKEAIPEFERVLKADPTSLPALLSLGAAYLELQQPARAIAPLQTVVKLQPDHVPSRGMLANALLTLNKPEEALPHFQKLTVLSPKDPKGWYGLGRCYEALANQAFEKLDKTAQGSPEWLALVGDSRAERGQYRSAFYFFKQALQLDPALSQAHTGLADVYRKTGHADWAAIVEAKAPKPDCIKAKEACAFAAGQPGVASSSSNPYWRVRGNNELARRAFLRLGEIPESVELHVLQAEILTEHSKSAEAVAQLRAARKLEPSDYRVARQLAVALHSAKDYDAAIVELEQIVRQEPNAPDLQFYLGDCWLQKAQPVKAIPYLQAAVKLDPSALPAQAALGTAYGRLGRQADAIPSLSAALPIDDDGSLHYQLSRALQTEGQTEKAEAMLKRYRELNERSEAEKQKLESEAVITAP